jgi:hypothetical protein
MFVLHFILQPQLDPLGKHNFRNGSGLHRVASQRISTQSVTTEIQTEEAIQPHRLKTFLLANVIFALVNPDFGSSDWLLAVETTQRRDYIRHHVLVFSKQHARNDPS